MGPLSVTSIWARAPCAMYPPCNAVRMAAFQMDPWETATIVDAGDVPFPRANDNEDCIQRITDFYRDIDASGRGGVDRR